MVTDQNARGPHFSSVSSIIALRREKVNFAFRLEKAKQNEIKVVKTLVEKRQPYIGVSLRKSESTSS